jgi:calcium-dependent protein kinase
VKIIDFGLADFLERLCSGAEEFRVPRRGVMGCLARTLPRIHKQPSRWRYTFKRVMQRAGTAPYMAPEVDDGMYDERADVFSAGIILCQMLTGRHPFGASKRDSRAAVRLKITAPFPVELPDDVFSHITTEAKDLCQCLLEKCYSKRLTAERALMHSWFADSTKLLPYGNPPAQLNEEAGNSVFAALCEYQASDKLKRAVLQLLARELPEQQLSLFRSQFMALDVNSNGFLCVKEMINGLQAIGCTANLAQLEMLAAAITQSSPQSPRIEYAEFLAATAWQHLSYDKDHLRECFRKLDRSRSGRISYADMCSALRGSADSPAISESEWEDLTVPVGRGGMHDRLEVTFERLVDLIER